MRKEKKEKDKKLSSNKNIENNNAPASNLLPEKKEDDDDDTQSNILVNKQQNLILEHHHRTKNPTSSSKKERFNQHPPSTLRNSNSNNNQSKDFNLNKEREEFNLRQSGNFNNINLIKSSEYKLGALASKQKLFPHIIKKGSSNTTNNDLDATLENIPIINKSHAKKYSMVMNNLDKIKQIVSFFDFTFTFFL